MSVECIHGLDDRMCDLCFPKPVPETTSVHSAAAVGARLRTATAIRARPSVGSAPRRTTSTPATRPGVPFKVGEQRIYHLTQVANLADILSHGELRCDPPGAIWAEVVRQARRKTEIVSGGVVADYVPFFLTPNARVWEAVRSSAPDPRLSPDLRGQLPADFVLIVSTIAKVASLATVVADRDATLPLTRFATDQESSDRMLRRLHGDDDAITDAEFLVKGAFPLELVSLIGVAHAKARDTVKSILSSSGYSTKVSVYPPWFQRPEE